MVAHGSSKEIDELVSFFSQTFYTSILKVKAKDLRIAQGLPAVSRRYPGWPLRREK